MVENGNCEVAWRFRVKLGTGGKLRQAKWRGVYRYTRVIGRGMLSKIPDLDKAGLMRAHVQVKRSLS